MSSEAQQLNASANERRPNDHLTGNHPRKVGALEARSDYSAPVNGSLPSCPVQRGIRLSVSTALVRSPRVEKSTLMKLGTRPR
jgi:hypothetical protein